MQTFNLIRNNIIVVAEVKLSTKNADKFVIIFRNRCLDMSRKQYEPEDLRFFIDKYGFIKNALCDDTSQQKALAYMTKIIERQEEQLSLM